MRTSMKILSAALALIIISLFIYDTKLKAEYLKGDFRNPFGDFVTVNFSGFSAIELKSATAVNLMIKKGPYKVSVSPRAGDFVKISQQGNKLIISAVFSDQYRSAGRDYAVFISCPDLTAFTSDARYEVNGLKIIDDMPNVFDKNPTLICGFNNVSLAITEDNGSNVRLENNKIDYLKATTGIGYHTGPILTIGPGNNFNNADFDIRNKGTLNIESSAGNHIAYLISDSAHLSISGAISKKLFKTTQP